VIDQSLLKILVCPETKSALALADEPVLDQLNSAIKNGEVKNRAGRVIDEPLQAGLLREDGKVLYPVREDIPIMMVDEGIFLS
jgi:uncharacterized protein YbaR (Trm112 family)